MGLCAFPLGSSFPIVNLIYTIPGTLNLKMIRATQFARSSEGHLVHFARTHSSVPVLWIVGPQLESPMLLLPVLTDKVIVNSKVPFSTWLRSKQTRLTPLLLPAHEVVQP
jgi:hypothetical protein